MRDKTSIGDKQSNQAKLGPVMGGGYSAMSCDVETVGTPAQRRLAAWIIAEEIARRNFTKHERLVLRLILLCSLRSKSFQATIPKLQYFVTYSEMVSPPPGPEQKGKKVKKMWRPHASVAVNALLEKQVIQLVSEGVYRFNVLFGSWDVKSLPDGAQLLDQLEMLDLLDPSLPDALTKNFVETQSILPSPGPGLPPASPEEREGIISHAQAGVPDRGVYREAASSRSPKSDTDDRSAVGGDPPQPSSSGREHHGQGGSPPQGEVRPMVTNNVTGAVQSEDASVTKKVTPGETGRSPAVTKNVTTARKANPDAGLDAVTKKVTPGPAHAAPAAKPLVSPVPPSVQHSYTDETHIPLGTHKTHRLIDTANAVTKNVTVEFENALWDEVLATVGHGEKALSYRPWLYAMVRDQPDKMRLLLSVLRNEQANQVINNPGGYLMGIWRNWKKDRRLLELARKNFLP